MTFGPDAVADDGAVGADDAGASALTASTLDAELVRRRLLAEITSGRLPVGAKVGSERQLAGALGVSRAVIRQVLAGFASAGLVRRVTGRSGGTFVSRLRVDHHATALESTRWMVSAQGCSMRVSCCPG